MSEIKVNSIKGVGASAAAITVNNSDGTCTANITNNLSNRRLTINGDMKIAQRGTSSTSSGYHTVDRFGVWNNGTDEVPTQAQVDVAAGTTPYTLGFRKALKITNGNQTSGAGAGDYIWIQHVLEAQDIANSGWNYTSSSSYVTLSFWVKSSVPQEFKFYVRTQDGTNKSYAMTTGSLSTDTWTKITKTIPGHSDLQFDSDNGAGFEINIPPFMGTDRTSNSVTENAWKTWNSGERFPDMTSTWYTTNDATFEITGVQLEVSDHASDFQFRSFAEELALCQRYYQVIAEGTNKAICNAVSFAGNDGFGFIDLKSVMRAAPTLDVVTGTGYWRAFRNAGVGDFNDVIMESNSNRTVGLKFQGVSSGTSLSTGQVGFIRTNNSAAFLAASSEL